MGNCRSKEIDNKVLVLQTGKLRAKSSEYNIEEQLPDNVFHRWLPPHLESKYEAIDFSKKFFLDSIDYFNIYDGNNHTVIIGQNESSAILLENVNIVVSCGSSSIQAFKLTGSGVLPILPVTDQVISNHAILGLKTKKTLNYQSTTVFGGDSNDKIVAADILGYIKANAFRYNDVGEKVTTNVVFVNQIGYSVLGFNPRDGPVLVPTPSQKIVSMRFYDNFKDNDEKTRVANMFREIADSMGVNNMFVVARQCKAYSGLNFEEELSGQWANQVHNMIKEERELRLTKTTFKYVLDLGGGSGTFYKRNEKGVFEKYSGVKNFMKGGKSSNDFEDSLNLFIAEFNARFSELSLE